VADSGDERQALTEAEHGVDEARALGDGDDDDADQNEEQQRLHAERVDDQADGGQTDHRQPVGQALGGHDRGGDAHRCAGHLTQHICLEQLADLTGRHGHRHATEEDAQAVAGADAAHVQQAQVVLPLDEA
jgi:hypothetical protein